MVSHQVTPLWFLKGDGIQMNSVNLYKYKTDEKVLWWSISWMLWFSKEDGINRINGSMAD